MESRGSAHDVDRSDDERIETTDVHDVLGNERRRHALEQLREEETLSVRELSELVATAETGEAPAPRDVRQSVYVSLQQTHLPKLDRLDVIDYDEEGHEVQLGESASDVAVYMEVVPRQGLTWAEYYASVALLGLLLVTGHAVGVPLLRTLPPLALGAAVLVVILASAVYQVAGQSPSPIERLRGL